MSVSMSMSVSIPACSTLLVCSLRGILKTICFLLMLQRLGAGSLFFALPRALLNDQVCVLSPNTAALDQLSVHVH